MAPKAKDDTAAKAEEAPKEKVREIPKALEKRDDKRAQYARLVVFNFLRSNPKTVGKKASDFSDVNAVSDADMLAGVKALTGGNMLDGPGGLDFISEHSANGSTTGRALTRSYASEVRPFIRKGIISDTFGRRGGLTEEEKAERIAKMNEAKEQKAKERAAAKEKTDAEKKAKKEADAKRKADKEAKAAASA